MVGFTDLRDAQPQKWRDAATGWKELANEALRASEDIHHRGRNSVGWYWPDRVGKVATQALADLADGFEVAWGICRSVMIVLDGAADAIAITQYSLAGSIDSANAHGLTVTSQGKVQSPCGSLSPDVDLANLAKSIQDDINDALRRANEIDTHTASELRKLAAHHWDRHPESEGSTMIKASRTEVQLLVDALPAGKPEAFVRHWWDSLTPQQRAILERAVPAQLMTLKGLPPEVYAGHVQSGEYNPTAAAAWAENHWRYQKFENDLSNNCSNFTSRAMEHGGLRQNEDWEHHDKSRWKKLYPFGTSEDYSGPWAYAGEQHDYLLKHGGQKISPEKANPGDIIYFKQIGHGNPDADPHEIYHAAIVTSVTPDGIIHYAQHTHNLGDVPLQDRIKQLDIHKGNQEYHIIRPPAHF